MTTTHLSDRGAAMLWVVLLTATSAFASMALACATPFEALAALAALHLRRRDGIALVLAAWAVNQLVGFGMLHYPLDASTVAWGAGIGLAAVAAAYAAYGADAAIGRRALPVRVVATFAAAFVAFKLVILAFALVLGGVSTTLSVPFATVQLARESVILIGLLALYRLLVAIGVPSARGRPVARLA